MKADKSYVALSAAIFALMGAVQLVRAASEWPVVINGYSVPVAFSYIVGPALLLLSGWAVAQIRRA
jgi:hypothetical protein